MMRALSITVTILQFVGAASAQWTSDASPSHIRVPPIEDADPAKLFADRLKQYKLRGDLAGMLKQSSGLGGFDLNRIRQSLESNPQLLEQARETLKGINLDDPKYAGLIESVIRSNNWNVDPALIKQLLQNFQRGSIGGGDPSARQGLQQQRSDGSGTSSFGSTNDDADVLRQKWARDIADWAGRFPKDKLNATLRDSPALKKLFEDVASVASRSSSGEGLDVQLARWQKRWDAVREWLPKNLPGLNLNELSAPDFRLPNLNLASPGAGGASSVLGTAADLLPVLYVALGAAALVVVVRLLRSRRTMLDPTRAALGPWPIAPNRVGNRRQLIRAFDYLAQIRCGPQARSWHHRTVAQQLPRNVHERSAAEELADLYEWARYSPQPGEPSPDVLDAARRRFTQLAEGAT